MEDQIQLSSNDMANDNVSVTQKNNKELEAVPIVLFRTSMTLHYEKQQHDQKRWKKQENKIEDFSFS